METDMTMMRVKKETVERLKKEASYGDSLNDVVERLLNREPMDIHSIKSAPKKVPITEKSQIKTIEDTTEYYENLAVKNTHPIKGNKVKLTDDEIKERIVEIIKADESNRQKMLQKLSSTIGIEKYKEMEKIVCEEQANLSIKIPQRKPIKLEDDDNEGNGLLTIPE